jgi:hypothetical protein
MEQVRAVPPLPDAAGPAHHRPLSSLPHRAPGSGSGLEKVTGGRTACGASDAPGAEKGPPIDRFILTRPVGRARSVPASRGGPRRAADMMKRAKGKQQRADSKGQRANSKWQKGRGQTAERNGRTGGRPTRNRRRMAPSSRTRRAFVGCPLPLVICCLPVALCCLLFVVCCLSSALCRLRPAPATAPVSAAAGSASPGSAP